MTPQTVNWTLDRTQQVESWLQEAGSLALEKHAYLRMHLKSDRTPVTTVEYQIEDLLIYNIQQTYPGHQILTEESGLIGSESEYLWIIDPIDGTKPYLRGQTFWGISIGLFYRMKPAAGFILFPALEEFYWGGEGGAFRNGCRLNLSPEQPFRNELVFLAIASNQHRYFDIRYPRIQAYGSTTFHLACLARGLAIGVLIRRVNLWDLAGFMPILSQLNIALEYTSGRSLDITPLLQGEKTAESLLAAPRRFLAELHDCIQQKPEAW